MVDSGNGGFCHLGGFDDHITMLQGGMRCLIFIPWTGPLLANQCNGLIEDAAIECRAISPSGSSTHFNIHDAGPGKDGSGPVLTDAARCRSGCIDGSGI